MRTAVLPDTFGQAAPLLANAGRVPLPSFTKAPELAPGQPLPWGHWQNRPMTSGELDFLIEQYGHAPMTGMVLAGSDLVVDIDADDPAVADALHDAASQHLGSTPQVRYGRGERRQLFYTVDRDYRISGLSQWAALQIMRHGRQTIVGGDHPDTGLPYIWTDAAQVPWTTAAPVIESGAVDRFLTVARQIAPPPASAGFGNTGRSAYFRHLAANMTFEQALTEALRVVVEGDRHNSLLAILGAATTRGMDDDTIWDAVLTGTASWTWSTAEVDRETTRALQYIRSHETDFQPDIDASPPRGPVLSRMARKKLRKVT